MPFELGALLERGSREGYALQERFLNPQIGRFLRASGCDRTYVRAEGTYLYDEAGARYLDFFAGFGVFAVGRNHPTVVRALREALGASLPSLVQLDAAPLAGLLAETLLARAPWLEKVAFCNSGTEAVEASLKFARAATGRPRVAFCRRGYHGLTYGSLSINGSPEFRLGYGPFLREAAEVPFGDAQALERELEAGDVAAFVVEPIQGHGVFEASRGYWVAAQELCRRHGTLLVCDEVQTGLGRTGRFYAVEHLGVEPDMLLLSKALSGGTVPTGAVLCRRSVFDRVFDAGERVGAHGSTYAKNLLAMVASLATVSVIDEEGLVENAAHVGAHLRARLAPLCERFEMLKAVRGRGLMLGLDFSAPGAVGVVPELMVTLLREHRVLAQPAGQKSHCLKILPPLNVTEADADWFSQALEATLETFRR